MPDLMDMALAAAERGDWEAAVRLGRESNRRLAAMIEFRHTYLPRMGEVPVEVPVSHSTPHSDTALERTSDHLTPPGTTDARDS